MSSGRWRYDDLLRSFTRQQRGDPDLLLENSEHPIAPAEREDDPPELNEDAGKQYRLLLPIPQPAYVIPHDISNYVTQNFHAYTVNVENNVPKQIVGAQEKRTYLRIKNGAAAGGDSVTINSDPNMVTFDGWVLAPGESITINVTCGVWAYFVDAVATVVSMHIYAEFAWPTE